MQVLPRFCLVLRPQGKGQCHLPDRRESEGNPACSWTNKCNRIRSIPRAAQFLQQIVEECVICGSTNVPFVAEGKAKQCSKAYKVPKHLLPNGRALTYYDERKPLWLQCDASASHCNDGAVIFHVLPEEERSIAFASRTLTSAEEKWCSTWEALVLIFGLEMF